MSKPVKEMILAEYQKRFVDLDGALVIDIRGIDANENNTLRLDLATQIGEVGREQRRGDTQGFHTCESTAERVRLTHQHG